MKYETERYKKIKPKKTHTHTILYSVTQYFRLYFANCSPCACSLRTNIANSVTMVATSDCHVSRSILRNNHSVRCASEIGRIDSRNRINLENNKIKLLKNAYHPPSVRVCVCVYVYMRTGEVSRMRTFRATKSLVLGLPRGPNGTANERNSIQSDIGKMLLLAGSRHKDTSSEKRGENCQEEDATFIRCHDIFASYLPFSPNAEARSYSGFLEDGCNETKTDKKWLVTVHVVSSFPGRPGDCNRAYKTFSLLFVLPHLYPRHSMACDMNNHQTSVWRGATSL